MAKRKESFFEMLSSLPWWISFILAGVSYIFLKDYFPAMQFEKNNGLCKGFQGVAPMFAKYIALFCLVASAISYFTSWNKKRLLENQSGIDSIRNLPWKQFEFLVGEAYRRIGFSVIDNPYAGADGGIDIRLKKNGNLFLVQCKNWKTYKVGVKEIRELFGLMTAENAAGGILVSAGEFTKDSLDFAKDKPIELINGSKLVEMISNVQESNNIQPQISVVSNSKVLCPNCENEMILRTAKKGANAGNQFWGCSKYPVCKCTKPVLNKN